MDGSVDRGAQDAGPEAQEQSDADRLAEHDILRLRAGNAGPLTLTGTNTWVVGRDPTWVLDPGPLLDEHVSALMNAVDQRGGLGGVALTHDHSDHSEALATLLAAHPAPLAAGRGVPDVQLAEGVRFGPFQALATPGHARDHFALVGAGACFTGDAVLGNGSVFISPYPGALSGYLRALTRLRMREDFDVLCPGHGPPVWDARAKLEEYVSHRLNREERLIAALEQGLRTVPELLDAVWSEVPVALRGAATATLAAHLDKLEDDHALPADVQRPTFDGHEW